MRDVLGNPLATRRARRHRHLQRTLHAMVEQHVDGVVARLDDFDFPRRLPAERPVLHLHPAVIVDPSPQAAGVLAIGGHQHRVVVRLDLEVGNEPVGTGKHSARHKEQADWVTKHAVQRTAFHDGFLTATGQGRR